MSDIIDVFSKVKENIDVKFHELFSKAKELAA